MFRHIHRIMFLFVIGLCIVLTACATNQPNGTQSQLMNDSENPYQPLEVKNKIPPEEENLPQPQGGSEFNVREPHPVSNYLLDRKYPNLIVLRGSGNSQYVALTFDDGPDRRFTPRVLDVLKRHNVKATFFLMGSRAKALPDVTKRIQREGHAIGNHTYWHPNLAKESIGRLTWEVKETDKVLQQLIGYRPKLFRAPYGALNEESLKKLGHMNNVAVGWSIDSLDWKQLNAEEIQKNVLSNMHPGAIVLMHSGGHWTQDLSGMVEALDTIIPRLKKDGIQFVTISEMFNLPLAK